MARPLAILRARISKSATRFARYALPAPQLAAPERVSPHEYKNKAGTKMLASAATGGGRADRGRQRTATRWQKDSRFSAEPELPRRDRRETPNRDQRPSER